MEVKIILTIIGVTAGCIILAISMFNLGKKKYEVNLDVDVKGIIDEAVNNFLQEREPVQCNHKWEDKNIINLYREGKSSENSLPISRIYVQQCKHCGVINKNKIEF